MKKIKYLLFFVTILAFAVACQNVNFRKAKSGMLYKVFEGKGKDSLIKNGWIVKFNVVYNLNDDSVLYSSYGKAPEFWVMQAENSSYNLGEVFSKMKNGDSAVIVQILDTLIKKGARVGFPTKKGDRIVTNLRILEVFTTDSAARADYEREKEKDRPRLMKEQEEQRVKAEKKQFEELEKSGELAKQDKEVQDYIAAKGIQAQKTGKGTYVYIKEQGTGPAAELGKYVLVKYSGRFLTNDSTFESGSYPFQLGVDGVVRGWVEGLQLFKQGGKGTLIFPGYLAYGPTPGPGGKPYEALVFDVEMLEVSDKAISPPPPPPPAETTPKK